jgi:hypothetical protein
MTRAVGRWCWRHPLLLVLLIALAAGLYRLHRRWRAPFREPAVVDYLTALRRTGVRTQDGETPRQLLARARALDLTPHKLEMLTQATAQHERQRYV